MGELEIACDVIGTNSRAQGGSIDLALDELWVVPITSKLFLGGAIVLASKSSRFVDGHILHVESGVTVCL